MDNQAYDITLIQRCRQKEDYAFTILALKYQPLMINKIKHYHIPTMDFEDLLQECRIVLFHAVHKYKLDSSIRFSSFYIHLLKHHFCELIRYHTAKKRQGEHVLSTNADVHDYVAEQYTGKDYSENLDPEKIVEVRECFEQAYELLNDNEKNVFYQSQVDMNFMANNQRIQNILYRSRHKIRKQLK